MKFWLMMNELLIAIFDTNTLVSATILKNSIPANSYNLAVKKCKLIFSSSSIAELAEVLSRKKFDKYVTLIERKIFFDKYIANSIEVLVTSSITDCRDPKDNKYLELAIDGKADYIVTGDKDLLVLHPYKNILIVTPAQYLDILTSAK